MTNLWDAPPTTFVKTLRGQNLWRACVTTNPATGDVVASHECLAPLADRIANDGRDYHAHEGSFFEVGKESGHLLSACVHLTRRGQAAGGIRFWHYKTVGEFVRDGLRLSRGMSHKNALAGLWWGGGKGVIARRDDRDHLDPTVRAAVYRDYGRFITGLCGCYVAAEDVGTTPTDMATVFGKTRHTTCIPASYGGSGNPSVLTAKGVVVAMEAALDELGVGNLKDKTIAMQGLGSVSRYMIGDLLDRGVARIVGVDINPATIETLGTDYPGRTALDLRTVSPDDTSIFGTDADVFAPNAVGATLNPRTIPLLKQRVVCGAANNQLEDPSRDAVALHERAILYVPDFLANRMGIVGCSNEQYGVFDDDPMIHAHLDRETPTGIYKRAREIFARAKKSGVPPAREAGRLADELTLERHPVWGHRGQEIINHLVRSGWSSAEPIA